MKRLWLDVIGVIILAVCILLVVLALPATGHSVPRKTYRIFHNLRRINMAVEQWALEHNQTNPVPVTKNDITPYLERWVKPVAGETYTLKTTLEPAEAELTRDFEGHPKGTVFRLRTNGVEIILPKPPSR